MKKKLESELVSIAHRILKLTGKEDLEKMQEEVALLYQKISILKFFDGHTDDGKIKEGISGASFFNVLDGAFNKTVSDSLENEDKEFVNIDNNSNDAIVEPATEKIKDIVAQMPQEANAVDELVEEINDAPLKKEYEQLAFADDAQLPIFDPVGIEESTEEKPLLATTKVSLNDKLKTSGFKIGLNDRLAFVNHLFDNNNEDYDRVISQLNSMDSLEEVSDFIVSIIKPDYNNWEGKGDYEARFLEIIEQKFN